MGIRMKEPVIERVIDLDGPQGNAFIIMAYAEGLAKELGLNSSEITGEMQQGDYTNLIRVFLKYFGDFVTVETSDESLLAEISQ